MTALLEGDLAPARFEGPVHIERNGRVGFIVIDNPPINAGSLSVRIGLVAALIELASDPGLDAGVLIGAGSTFIAGSDLKEFSSPLIDPQVPAVVAAIEACPKPIVAAIHGAALGGGYEIAMACDGRVAVENAVVGLPEGTFGIIPGAGGTVRLPRLVDATTALEIITTRRRVTATEAKMLGLVDMVIVDLRADASAYALALGGRKLRLREVPPKPYDPDAFEQAAETAMRKERGRPHVIEAIAAVRRSLAQPIDVALAEERAVFQRLRMSEESAALRHIFFAEREAARVEGLSGVQPLPPRSVGIVGAGTMGAGIAASFLLAGLPVTLTDLKPEALTTARDRIDGFVARAPGAARAAALTIADSLDGVADCDLILEAVFEDMEVKRSLMAALDAGTRPDAILASNTSYLDLDEIAAATRRPASVIGLHFFAPAHIMKLLEIVRGAKTSAAVLATAVQLGRKLGKIAVVAGVCEGFIGNRIYNAYRAQCEAMLIEGSTPMEVDEAMEAFGFAMGPFAVWDLSGLDIAWANRKRKLDASGDRGAFAPLLEWLVGEGRLGRKTGAGWYRYVGGEAARQADMHVADLIDRARGEHGRASQAPTQEAIQQRSLAAIVNEGLLILEDGIAARASDIDLVMINGYGFPKHLGGPLHWAARLDRAEIGWMLDAIVVSGARRGDLGRLDCGALR
jgi:3-hydroxyacyl-CoA dehydrogenase